MTLLLSCTLFSVTLLLLLFFKVCGASPFYVEISRSSFLPDCLMKTLMPLSHVRPVTISPCPQSLAKLN